MYPRNFTRISELGHRVKGNLIMLMLRENQKITYAFFCTFIFFSVFCFLFSLVQKFFFFFFSFTFRKKSLIKFFPYFD